MTRWIQSVKSIWNGSVKIGPHTLQKSKHLHPRYLGQSPRRGGTSIPGTITNNGRAGSKETGKRKDGVKTSGSSTQATEEGPSHSEFREIGTTCSICFFVSSLWFPDSFTLQSILSSFCIVCFLKVSRSDRRNYRERDGMCTNNTSPHAHFSHYTCKCVHGAQGLGYTGTCVSVLCAT